MAEAAALLALYRRLAPAVYGLAPLFAPVSPKLRAGLAGRRGWRERCLAAAPALRGCVWIHVTSVGEYEQARPLIAALRQQPAAPPIAVTHFSPSGREYAVRRPAADHHDYLPLDTPAAMRTLVDAWRPRVLVFVKFDCWPAQVLAAAEAGVPIVLLAGTLQPRSARLWPPLRPFFRALFDRFAALGVCTEEDRRRFVDTLGVRRPVQVTGDTRAEQVIRRFEAAQGGPTATLLGSLGGRRLVLGSTWPPDEALWLPVLPELASRFPDLRVVIVPHEPTPPRLERLARQLTERGLAVVRLSALEAAARGAGRAPAGPERCVLVDSVGKLAEIYAGAALAYVGGSFTTGVHNTMEPAVASLPVLFGPRIHNAVEASELARRGAGWVVRRPAEAAARAAALLADPAALAAAGEAARAVVLEQRGAVEKSLALLRACS